MALAKQSITALAEWYAVLDKPVRFTFAPIIYDGELVEYELWFTTDRGAPFDRMADPAIVERVSHPNGSKRCTAELLFQYDRRPRTELYFFDGDNS